MVLNSWHEKRNISITTEMCDFLVMFDVGKEDVTTEEGLDGVGLGGEMFLVLPLDVKLQ